MNQFEALLRKTFWTRLWLLYFRIFQHDSYLRLAFDTLEEGPFHFRYDIAGPDDDSSKGNESIDLFRSNRPHNFDILQILDCDHDPVSFSLFFHNLFRLQIIGHAHFFEHALNYIVEAHDHFCWKVDKLKIQILIKLF